jgi:hypothetical protein
VWFETEESDVRFRVAQKIVLQLGMVAYACNPS